MIRNVLFDLDDTLLDFHAAERIAFDRTLRSFGAEPTDELAAQYSRINALMWKRLERKELTRTEVKLRRFSEFIAESGLPLVPEKTAACYEKLLAEGHIFIDGAEELLHKLYGSYRLYLVSNGTTAVQRGRIASAGIAPLFDGIFPSEEIGVNKPDKLFFDRCFARIPDFRQEETLIIGDSLTSDIKGGKNAGIRTVWFNPQHLENRSDVQPDAEIHALGELPTLLETF